MVTKETVTSNSVGLVSKIRKCRRSSLLLDLIDFGLSDSESEEEGGDEVYCYSGQAVCKRGELSALEIMVDGDSSKVSPPVKCC